MRATCVLIALVVANAALTRPPSVFSRRSMIGCAGAALTTPPTAASAIVPFDTSTSEVVVQSLVLEHIGGSLIASVPLQEFLEQDEVASGGGSYDATAPPMTSAEKAAQEKAAALAAAKEKVAASRAAAAERAKAAREAAVEKAAAAKAVAAENRAAAIKAAEEKAAEAAHDKA